MNKKYYFITFIIIIFIYNVKGESKHKKLITYDFNDFLKNSIRTNSTFIFEYNKYHHECIPGFVKYFEDLDFNVDILILKGQEDSMELYPYSDHIHLYLFDSIKQIEKKIKIVRKKVVKYNYIFINTLRYKKWNKKLLRAIGAWNSTHSYFVDHDTKVARKDYFGKGHIFTLGYFQGGVQVNPHYFGDVEQHNKNKRSRFFMTSTINRKYKTFINASEIVEAEGLDFEVIVTGRYNNFSEKNLPSKLKSHYHFKHFIPYIEMYQEIEKSDYIIVTLGTNNKDAKIFKTLRCSGSVQLGYGFNKPMLIHEDYAALYNLTNTNSFLFNDENFVHVFKKAIKLTDKEYRDKQINLNKTANEIYNLSLKNLKNSLNLEETN